MEPPLKKLNDSTCANENQDELNETQTEHSILTYDVLRIIFQYLSAKDLYKTSTICRVWRDAANKEAATRRAPEYIIKNFQVTNNENANNSYGEKHVDKDLRIKPIFGLICTHVPDEEQWSSIGCYCENLPLNCSSVILGGYDIVADDTKIEDKFGMAVCAFLPDVPKLSHKIYHVNSQTFKGISNVDMIAHVDKLVKELLPSKTEKSKCIIMLTNGAGYKFSKFLIRDVQKRYKPGTISLWGGICVDLKLCEATNSSRVCSQSVQWTAITLSSPSLQSWSTVLHQSSRTETQMQEKLEDLKKNIQLKKHSLGLMFACCERIDMKELEVAVFKKVFPKVPLVGLHGDGEYGLNTLKKKRENRLQLSCTTVFLILTYQ